MTRGAWSCYTATSDHTHHLTASIREMFVHYCDVLDLSNHLPHLPDPVNGPAFYQALLEYVGGDEWKRYKANVVSDPAHSLLYPPTRYDPSLLTINC